MSASKLSSNFRHRYYPDSLMKLNYPPPSPLHRTDHTLPKFHHSKSDSRLPSSQSQPRSKELRSISSKLYRKLDSRLKEIQDSISELQQRRKKKIVPRKRAITQISQNGQSLKLQQQILHKIAEIKATATQLPPERHKPAPLERSRPLQTERILFYGADYIDGVSFKIKIKMEKGQYYLYGKNAHAKMMLEMTESDYKVLHQGLLRENPCNIFRYLSIENNQLRLRLKGSNQRAPSSLRCYLGYY